MSDEEGLQKLKVPVHVYVLMIVLLIGGVLGVAVYNKQTTQTLLSSPETARNIATSDEFDQVLNRKLEQAFSASNSDLDLDDLLAKSKVLQARVEDSVARRLVEYGQSQAFQNAVSAALPRGPDVDEGTRRLQQIQIKMKQYEAKLAKISSQVNDDESAQAVNALQSNFVELQQMMSGLSKEVRCSLAMKTTAKSSFLLKEKRSTQLQVYNLVVTLGRVRKNIIDSVTISGPNADKTQTDTRVVANVKLGSRMEFQSGGHNYEGVFTFKQARFGPDFVGFEVQEMLAPAKNCPIGAISNGTALMSPHVPGHSAGHFSAATVLGSDTG